MASTDFPPEVLARVSPEILASMVKVRIPGGVTPLRLWPKQREILKALQDPGVDELVILKARQIGVTQIVALYALSHAIRIAASHSLIVSKGDREAQEASARVRQMYASLPTQVKRQHSIYHKNLEEFRLTHPELSEPVGNMEDVVTSDIRNLPAGAGRSYSSDLLIADEFDWWDSAAERMADIEPTLTRSGKLVIASTANGFGGPLHTRWIRAKTNPRARTIFVGALDRPGRTAEWVKERRDRLGSLGPQEYPVDADEAFLASGSSAFDAGALNWQIEHITSPSGGIYTFSKQGATRAALGWQVWEEPKRNRRYLVGADPAGGGPHSDPSAAAVYDIDSWEQVAAFHGRPLPHEFARELAYAGTIYNNALLAPESNFHGQGVLAHLVNLGYGHIYEPEKPTSYVEQKQRGRTLGWLTNQKTKAFMVDTMRTALRERTIAVRDAEAIEELMRYQEVAPGRYDGKGGHDDRVICHCICAAILSYSRRTAYQTQQARELAPTWEVADSRAGY